MTFTFAQTVILLVLMVAIYFTVCWWNAARPDWTEIRDLFLALVGGGMLTGLTAGVKKYKQRKT